MVFQLGTIYKFTSFHVINPRNVTSPVKNDGWKLEEYLAPFGFRPIFRGKLLHSLETNIINIAPENRPSQKETNIPTIHF